MARIITKDEIDDLLVQVAELTGCGEEIEAEHINGDIYEISVGCAIEGSAKYDGCFEKQTWDYPGSASLEYDGDEEGQFFANDGELCRWLSENLDKEVKLVRKADWVNLSCEDHDLDYLLDAWGDTSYYFSVNNIEEYVNKYLYYKRSYNGYREINKRLLGLAFSDIDAVDDYNSNSAHNRKWFVTNRKEIEKKIVEVIQSNSDLVKGYFTETYNRSLYFKEDKEFIKQYVA